jgi:hypothetical protein
MSQDSAMVTDMNLHFKKGSCKHDTPKVRLTISDSAQLLNKQDWDSVLQDQDLFLSTEYLWALEQAMDDTMEFRYIIYYCEQYTPIGIAYFQVVDLVDTGSRYAEQVKKLGSAIGSKVVRELKVRSLVNGNVFHCGEHGYHFSEKVSPNEQLELVENTANRLKADDDLNSKVSIIVFKEYWPESFELSEELVKKRYHMFRMDMNMVLDVHPTWVDFEAYLSSLTSKSRTRVKAIFSRSEKLVFRDMTVQDIRAQSLEMDRLFKNVLSHSSFTFGVLEMEAYANWKELIGDRLIIQSVHCEDKMVGFLSAFDCGEELDIHYVGLDYDCNKDLGLYQRMLVEFLKMAIAGGYKRVNYGRTAEQAKSSLGAVPVEMRLYTKHRNLIANRLIGPLMASVTPSEFELRFPFKKEKID